MGSPDGLALEILIFLVSQIDMPVNGPILLLRSLHQVSLGSVSPKQLFKLPE
jgi:hypothetical protein